MAVSLIEKAYFDGTQEQLVEYSHSISAFDEVSQRPGKERNQA